MSGQSRIMKYIPRSKKEAVKDAYADQDGYWIILKDGWTGTVIPFTRTPSRSCDTKSQAFADVKNNINTAPGVSTSGAVMQ